MKTAVFLIAFMWISFAEAGDGYGSCYVKNGTAHALFCSQTSDSDSGTGYVTTFDRQGNQLNRSMLVWVGVAVMGCNEVGNVSAGEDAVGCYFDLGK